MATARIFLDSQGGQPPSRELLALTSNIANLSWSDGISRHYEASLSQNAIDTALASLADHLGLNKNQILPVHRLGNALGFLASIYSNTAVSKASRSGALEIFAGPHLNVDGFGRVVSPPKCESFFAPAANQETGVIEDIEKIKSETGGIAITDATEWVGRKPNLPAGDFLVARASSWGGSNSVCFVIATDSEIYIDPRRATSLMPSNFDLIYSIAAFDELKDISQNEVRTREYSTDIKKALAIYPNVTVHGDENSIAHLISFAVENVDSETAAIAFDKFGISVGSGSACLVSQSQSSHVLQAMGINCAGNVRLSIPINFLESDLEIFLERLPKVMQELSETL